MVFPNQDVRKNLSLLLRQEREKECGENSAGAEERERIYRGEGKSRLPFRRGGVMPYRRKKKGPRNKEGGLPPMEIYAIGHGKGGSPSRRPIPGGGGGGGGDSTGEGGKIYHDFRKKRKGRPPTSLGKKQPVLFSYCQKKSREYEGQGEKNPARTPEGGRGGDDLS